MTFLPYCTILICFQVAGYFFAHNLWIGLTTSHAHYPTEESVGHIFSVINCHITPK